MHPSCTLAAGELRVEPLWAAERTRIAALTIQYADQHLGGVDSSLVAVLSDSAKADEPRATVCRCFGSARRFGRSGRGCRPSATARLPRALVVRDVRR